MQTRLARKYGVYRVRRYFVLCADPGRHHDYRVTSYPQRGRAEATAKRLNAKALSGRGGLPPLAVPLYYVNCEWTTL